MHAMTFRNLTVLLLLLAVATSGFAVDRLATLSRASERRSVPNPRVVKMVDDRRGWTVADGSVWFTDDGARTWRGVPTTRSTPPNIVGKSWGVLASGRMWALLQFPGGNLPVDLIHIAPTGSEENLPLPCATVAECLPSAADFDPDGTRGYLFALAPSGTRGQDQILGFRTEDAGVHWTRIATPTAAAIRGDIDVRMADRARVAIIVNCDIYVSADSGRSWARSDYGRLAENICSADAPPLTLRFVAPGIGWLRTHDGWIIETNDACVSWSASPFGRRAISFPGTEDQWISFADRTHGLAVINGRVFATRNGGLTWAPVNASNDHFWSVSCVKSRCVLVSETSTLEFVFGE